jgi:predicted ribosomally synthesized peptide with nif11-like leader
MSVQAARDFLKQLETDKPLQEKLKAAPDLAARQQIIKAAGFDFSITDYKQVVEELTLAAGQEISPEESQKIAAGLGWRSGVVCPPVFEPPSLPM